MSKYDKITEHLNALKSSEWLAGFKELETILGFTLPASARLYPAWWANDPNQGRHAHSWLLAGWQTEDLNLTGETVTFRRHARADKALGKISKKVVPQKPIKTAPKIADLPIAPGLNPLVIEIKSTWRTLGTLEVDDGKGLKFPAIPDVSGLYRFRLIATDMARHYIGETARLRRRFAHYRNPGPSQTTNIRIKALFIEHLNEGHKIEIDVLTEDASMVINGQVVEPDFSDKATRRLFENAVLVAEGGENIESLNR